MEGRIDVLINNAGVGITGPLEEIPLEEIKNNHSASKVIFSLVEYNHTPKITSYGLFMSIVLYPSLPIYIPHALLSGNQTQFNVIILEFIMNGYNLATVYHLNTL